MRAYKDLLETIFCKNDERERLYDILSYKKHIKKENVIIAGDDIEVF